MIIDEKDIQILEENYIPNIRILVEDNDIDEILDTIDDMIVDDILEHDDEPGEVGRELQLIYDRIERGL